MFILLFHLIKVTYVAKINELFCKNNIGIDKSTYVIKILTYHDTYTMTFIHPL